MLSALALAESGLSVAIIDKGDAAQQASWAGGGILSPLPPWQYPDVVNALAEQSQQLYPLLCEHLKQQTGIDAQWWRCGMRVLNAEPAATRWLNANGQRFIVDNESLSLPDVAQIRTPRLGRAVRAAVMSTPTITLFEKSPVAELILRSARCSGVKLDSGDLLFAETTIIAAGAWSAGLLPDNHWQPAIEPVRGQMLLFKPEDELLHEVLLSDKRYLIPRRDGRILIGSTLEPVGFDVSTTAVAAEELRAAAIELLPELAHVPVEHHWAGLRPGSRDGVPTIGEHPDIANLHYNSGHYRNGVVLAPASAKLLAAQITSGVTRPEFTACLPSEQQVVGE